LGRAASVSAAPGQPLWYMTTFERGEMSLVCKQKYNHEKKEDEIQI
jgi:hypothetical protein